MDENVVSLRPKEPAENPDVVLEAAIGAYSKVFVMGVDKEGNLDVRASLNLPYKEVLWLLETFKHNLLAGNYFE